MRNASTLARAFHHGARVAKPAVTWILLGAAWATLTALRGSSPLGFGGLESSAAAAEPRPGIVPVPPNALLTERRVYPPGIAVGDFDGAYRMATLYKSAVFAANKVAIWESEAGVLKASNYPMDEFIYVLEGHLVTIDADGTRREFHPGDSFVLPKGWAGTWDMKSRFKKIIVNF